MLAEQAQGEGDIRGSSPGVRLQIQSQSPQIPQG